MIPSINVKTGTDNSSAPLVPVDVPCARMRLSVSDICSSAVSRRESISMPKLLFIVLLRTTCSATVRGYIVLNSVADIFSFHTTFFFDYF